MDTRLRKFKYSFFTKLLCWLIAVVLFCLSFTVALRFVMGCYVLGPENFFEGKTVSYYETKPFLSQFHADFFSASNLGRRNSEEFRKLVDREKSAVVEATLAKYLDSRGSLIEQELSYAVENWDVEYYAYEDDVVDAADATAVSYNTRNSATTVPETPENIKSDSKLVLPEDASEYISVPDYAPDNIKLASYALNTCSSTKEYNKYAGLVREDAFSGEFYHRATVDMSSYNDSSFDIAFGIYYTLNEAQAKTEFIKQYDEQASADFIENVHILESKARLEERENLKYYIIDFDGAVFSNIDEIPANLSGYKRYVLANEDNVTVKGFDSENLEMYLKNYKVKKLCIYFDEEFKGDDIYKNYLTMYESAVSDNADSLIVIFAVLLVLFLVVLVVWLRLVGRNPQNSEAKTTFVEKIPNDIHTALSVGALVGLGYLFLIVLQEFYYDISIIVPIKIHLIVLFVFLVIALAVLTEWLASVVRTKKAGESWFKNTLIFKLVKLVARFFKFLFGNVIRKLVGAFKYKPKAYKIRFIFLFVGYVLMNILLGVMAGVAGFYEGVLLIAFAVLFLAFNLFVGYLLVKYVNNLDKIIVASSEHEDVEFSDKKVYSSLKLLADNLSEKNAALDEAVAEAVKNEQMKTQLITNVSHDLKTPLTSLVSYSDLLTKCEIQDEDAKKYIDVINQQSAKLKRLIEDLIEASKVSTGNVTLNKTKLNLSELAVQAIVEFTPDFENNRNEIKFSEPPTAPVVFADGTKTYRIISNLLSNAKKYSAADTRVYASVYTEGDFGCFEIKNISKEPLNISAEQLTERFVRGDESRTKEGNGLGLSIAKDLCQLQSGSLSIKIDGDLFKAIVKLPITH